MTLKRIQHLGPIPSSGYSMVSHAELPMTDNTPSTRVVIKTYMRSDVVRHNLESCVHAERAALVLLSNNNTGKVPRLLSAQATPTSLSLVMTLAPGVPASVLPRPLPLNRTSRISRNLLSSLRVIHAAGVVHADVALRNVIVDCDNDDAVCVVDFGSCFINGAHVRDPSQTTTASVTAPEMLETTVPDPTADIWALGVFAWACMFGGPGPFRAETSAKVLELVGNYAQGRFDIIDAFRDTCRTSDVSYDADWVQAEDFIRLCLSRMPESRFAKPNSDSEHKDWQYVVDYERILAHPFLNLSAS